MRYALTFATLIASTVGVLGASIHHPRATPTSTNVERGFSPRDGFMRLNPPSADIKNVIQGDISTKKRANPYNTNAKRLAAGLPLKAPTRRSNRPHAPRQSSTPCTNGYITIAYDTTSGYISNQLNDYGEYHATTPSACDASALQVCAFPGSLSPSDIRLVNPDLMNTPFFGGIEGFGSDSASLSSTSSNYITLGGTAESASSNGNTDNTYSHALGGDDYDTPAESQIWTIAPDGTMGLTWTNEDGSQVTASMGYSEQDAFVATADTGDFTAGYGAFSPAVLKFVPATSVSCTPA